MANKVDIMKLWDKGTEIEFFRKSRGFATPKQLFYMTGDGKYLAYWPKGYKGKKTTLQSRNALIGNFTEKWCIDLLLPFANKINAFAVQNVVNEEIRLTRQSPADVVICKTRNTIQRPEDQIEKDYDTWERTYFSLENVIDAREISTHQKDYVMFMNYFQLNNLIDLKPVEGSVHIRSMCEPFSEEMEPDQKRIDNWLRLFGLYPECRIHSSGHARGPAIFDMIQKINPKKLFPIHTVNPAAFKELSGINIVFPEYEKKITI